MTEELDETAQRIADQGRDALLERLRPAFEEAAAAHADVLELDADKLERMVQQAADRADGLQWRRALASVATEELGVTLGEALGHPAVVRAQAIVGAPSYEEGLAAIAEGNVPAGVSEPPDADVPRAGTEAPSAGAQPEAEAERGPEPEAEAEGGSDAEAEPAPDPKDAGGRLPVSVTAIHLDGLSELDGEGELELRFTDDGLDVVGERDEAALAHFAWNEIDAVEVQPGRGRMLRRRAAAPRLILTASGRHARFEARGADAEELKRELVPALTKLDAR